MGFWSGFIIGGAALGLPFGLFCWVMGDWGGYDRAQREKPERQYHWPNPGED